MYTSHSQYRFFGYNIQAYLRRLPARKGERIVSKGLPFTMISALFGWWGLPFGPKYTLESIRTNLKGGKDVTDEVMATAVSYIISGNTG